MTHGDRYHVKSGLADSTKGTGEKAGLCCTSTHAAVDEIGGSLFVSGLRITAGTPFAI
jgi:hypothetical protein